MLEASRGDVDSRKLERLGQWLKAALAQDLNHAQFTDAIVLRKKLAAYMEESGSARGAIEGAEQLLMGVIRRAALTGVIAAPPEGPWTMSWQEVLERCESLNGVRAAIRSLAGWATASEVEPENVGAAELRLWVEETAVSSVYHDAALRGLGAWRSSSSQGEAGNALLFKRLRAKAQTGSVRRQD